jgi:glycosyltransferase involved in cell wall biosynthesis
MKLHALINLYNDRTFLAAALESIKDVVDRVVVADGAYNLYFERYKEFVPDAQPSSTDGSLEIVKSFKDLPDLTILTAPGGVEKTWENQAVKRTALINQVPVDDWLIIIDADEMIQGDLQEAMEQVYESGCIVASCPLYNPGTQVERVIPQWHPRVFQKLEGMKYEGTHWHLKDNVGRIIEEKYPIYWTDIFAFTHFKPFKDQTRLIPHNNYMVDLMNRGWLEPRDIDEVLKSIQINGR